MTRICEATGLPESYLSRNFIDWRLVPCLATTFSDGELVVLHPPETDPVLRCRFGEQDFREGVFGKRLRQLFEGNDTAMRYQADSLIRAAAQLFAEGAVAGSYKLPSAKLIKIDSLTSTLHFDNISFKLERPPRVVFDYGPGLQGRFRIEEQLTQLLTHQTPYTYLPIGKGPFINEFLQRYWAVRLGDDSLMSEILGRLYIGREDGMATATTEFLQVEAAYGNTEIADIVIASGVHSAEPNEIEVAIANAHTLLRPEGVLLLRAPKKAKDASDKVTASAMVDMALQAGFTRQKAKFYDIVTGGGGLVERTQSLAAVLQK